MVKVKTPLVKKTSTPASAPTQPAKSIKVVLLLVRVVGTIVVFSCWWYLFKKETAIPESPKSAVKLTPSQPLLVKERPEVRSPVLPEASPDPEHETPAEDSTPVDPVEAEWHAVATAITDAVVDNAYPEALCLAIEAGNAHQSQANAGKLKELEGILRELPDMDRLVMDGVIRAIGQEIVLNQNGKPRRVIVRAVSSKAMSASEVSPSGKVDEKNTVTISAESLDPRDKLKWLGNADSPARAMMKCLLHKQGGNDEQAREYANKSGPLGPFLLAWIESAPAADETAP